MLRFLASGSDCSVTGIFPIKRKSFSRAGVRNFGVEIILLELESEIKGGRPSKTHSRLSIDVMNSSLSLVICALAMSS